MRERPILFSSPMVRALLAGTKTQTRRVLKAEPPPGAERVIRPFRDERLHWAATDPHDMEQGQLLLGEAPGCPYGQPGDRLWVRETWAPLTVGYAYRADLVWNAPPADRWHPSIHMPRAASRITLEVTGVRVERLQDISEADAKAEGMHRCLDGRWSGGAWPHLREPNRYDDPIGAFCDLWASINGGASWDSNPFVWCVSFRVIRP